MNLTTSRRFLLTAAAVLAAVAFTYSNHFENALQFDDLHVIRDNIFVRSLENVPRFFTDPVTQSLKPENRNWRPLVMTTVAIDYWLGGGLRSTFYFHLSTFLWFLLQLVLMYFLYAGVLERVRPDPRNFWIAWFAAACYGLHPVMAETVNYIVQRAETLSTVALVAALVVYARFPQHRARGYYLALFAVATLAKAPALVFPLLLLAYVILFEESVSGAGLRAALRKSVPSFAMALPLVWLQRAMTPSTFLPANRSTAEYVLAQPYVILRYFRSFFWPTQLCADSGLGQTSNPPALAIAAGFLFLAALLAGIYYTARRLPLRPIAFGLVWFLIALAPTSLFPLGEMENDHRMYFPFVGLMLAVVWAGSLLLLRGPLWEKRRSVVLAGLACLLLVSALGVRQRNEVWRTDETLWRDVIEKYPENGRGLASYAMALVERQQFQAAVPYLQRSVQILPQNPYNESGLGVALAALGRNAEAEPHFHRAIELRTADAGMHFYYARWLYQQARTEEAASEALTSLHWNPSYMHSRYLLLQIYAEHGLWQDLQSFAQQSLAVNPGVPIVPRARALERQLASEIAVTEEVVRSQPSPENFLSLSSGYHRAGRYADCIAAAQQAIRLQPGFAEAYSNMAAAYASLQQWDNSIAAAREALRLKPGFEFARRNLEFAAAQKAAAGSAR